MDDRRDDTWGGRTPAVVGNTLIYFYMNEELLIQFLKQGHDDLKESFRAGIHGLQKTVEANAEVAAAESGAIREAVAAIVKRLDKMNGNVARLQEESNSRQAVVSDFRALEANCKYRREWPKKNWLYLAIGGFVVILAVMVLYDVVGLRGIIELAKGMR